MKSRPSTTPVCHVDDGEVVDVPWGRILLGASGSLGNATKMTFGRATILAGQQNPRHRHPNCDEVLHVLSGRVEHILGEESFILEPGDTISIPEGIWHQARVIGEDNAEVVICFSSADRVTQIDECGG